MSTVLQRYSAVVISARMPRDMRHRFEDTTNVMYMGFYVI